MWQSSMARLVPKQILDEIRFRNDIVEVVGSYFTLKRVGNAFKALCPFHKEKTPSFHVNPQKQIFHCFGCGAGGDVFRFVMQYENVDFMTAVRMLAQRAGIRLELEVDQSTPRPDKDTLYGIHEEVTQFYQQCLRSACGETARRYLTERMLPDKVVEEFRIGYAPNRWNAVLEWGLQRGYEAKMLETCGLVLKREDSDSYYDRFRHRLMFPICDERNRVIGFSGRALKEDGKTAKYVNSPDTVLFHKSRVLYALNKARRAIAEIGEAIVCEGQIDVIRCHQAGFTRAVAAQGTAFTEEHARILKRYAESVILVFDPDRAGQNAAIRTATLFMETGLAVRIAQLRPGYDPDLFIRTFGAAAFQKNLEEAQSVVAFQISALSKDLKLDEEVGAMRIARAVLSTIAHSPDPVQRDRLINEAVGRLRLPIRLEEELRELLRREREKFRRSEMAEEQQVPSRAGPPAEELALCEHLLHVNECPELASFLDKYLPLDMITDGACHRIAEMAIEASKGGKSIEDLINAADDPTGELGKLMAQLLSAPRFVKGEFSRTDAVRDIILYKWRKKLEQERNRLGTQDAKRRTQITYDLRALRKWETGAPVIELELSS